MLAHNDDSSGKLQHVFIKFGTSPPKTSSVNGKGPGYKTGLTSKPALQGEIR